MKAAKEGKTMYGPINYSERAFYDYKFGNAIIRLKEKLVEEGELVIDDKALLNDFEKLKGTVYREEELFEDYARQVRDAYIEKIYARYIMEQSNLVDIVLTEDRLNEYMDN